VTRSFRFVFFSLLIGLVGGDGAALEASAPQAWLLHADFELGEVGAYAYPTPAEASLDDAFDERAADGALGWADTRYSDVEAFEGRQSAAVSVQPSQENLGARIHFPRPLRKGDEIWIRLRLKFQAAPPYDFTGTPMLKLLRLKPRLSDESDSYDNDILINNPDGVNRPFVFSLSHPAGGNVEGGAPGADDPAPGRWETYELHQTLDDAAGGGSRTRFWKDGRLLIESDTPILKTDRHEIRFFELMGYWNGGAPVAQTLWIDDIQLQNHVPSGRDGSGNAFLGVADDPPDAPAACDPDLCGGVGDGAGMGAPPLQPSAPSPPETVTACSDGLDNDGDGRIDHPEDRGCKSVLDDNERRGRTRSRLRACRDGVDNDADGLADFPADEGCRRRGDRTE
jgi:hypothetical protein